MSTKPDIRHEPACVWGKPCALHGAALDLLAALEAALRYDDAMSLYSQRVVQGQIPVNIGPFREISVENHQLDIL